MGLVIFGLIFIAIGFYALRTGRAGIGGRGNPGGRWMAKRDDDPELFRSFVS
jgi:hypothetical protein